MRTCPSCRYATLDDADTCPDCGGPLADLPAGAVTVTSRPRATLAGMPTPADGLLAPPPTPLPEDEPAPAAPSQPLTRQSGSVLLQGLARVSPGSEASGVVPGAVTVRGPGALRKITELDSTVGTDVTPAPAVEPRLVVVRGEQPNAVYRVVDGKNYLGRSADKPVDIDLDGQEPIERVWTSRQHAVLHWEGGVLAVEDLNSLNGTFVNRARVHPGHRYPLRAGDVIQVGTVQLRVVM